MIISVGLLLTLIIPTFGLYATPISGFAVAFTNTLSFFLDIVGPFFNNVRGLLNYVISYTFGEPIVVAFNALLYVGLLAPYAGLLVRLYLAVRRYVL